MCRFVGPALLAGLWTALVALPAQAQFSAPSAERIFGFYDRDGDGELDEDEMERVRGPLRETLEGKREVDRDEFVRLFEEQQRRRDDDGDNRRPSTAGRSAPKVRERVTVELSSKYTPGDRDGDGQVGLHEWIEWKSLAAIREFLVLDINRDGFLTPREVLIAEKANGTGNGGAGGAAGSGTAAAGRPSQGGTAPAGAPRELDEATARVAREAFKNLDRDDDGRLSDEEWRSSQATRTRFEGAGVRLSTPADLETFLKLYPVEERELDVGGDVNGGGSTGGSGEERSRRGGFGRGR
jgi:EF hand